MPSFILVSPSMDEDMPVESLSPFIEDITLVTIECQARESVP
jgi:hypothetical protein